MSVSYTGKGRSGLGVGGTATGARWLNIRFGGYAALFRQSSDVPGRIAEIPSHLGGPDVGPGEQFVRYGGVKLFQRNVIGSLRCVGGFFCCSELIARFEYGHMRSFAYRQGHAEQCIRTS